jgi:hypothetical protein
MKRLMTTLAATLLAIVSSAELFATTVRTMSNRELTEQADVIVIGKGLTSRTVWQGRRLFTLVNLNVSETLKGAPQASVTVAVPGGTDLNRRVPVSMSFPGAPTIKRGEEVVLFLAHTPAVSDGYVVLGFSQGKFSILAQPAGDQVVSRDLTNIQLQGGVGVVPGAASRVPLSRFRAEIRGYLK